MSALEGLKDKGKGDFPVKIQPIFDEQEIKKKIHFSYMKGSKCLILSPMSPLWMTWDSPKKKLLIDGAKVP